MIGVENVPDLFARTSIWKFLLPPAILLLMHLLHLDVRIAEIITGGWIIVSLLLLPFSNLAAIAGGIWLSFSTPASLVTSGWDYTQSTSVVVLIMYFAALAVKIYFSILTNRSSKQG